MDPSPFDFFFQPQQLIGKPPGLGFLADEHQCRGLLVCSFDISGIYLCDNFSTTMQGPKVHPSTSVL